MKEFMNEDFLLETEAARRLYHDYAASMPIYDYHCHLPPDEIAQDRRFANLSKIWLNGDHYKWRAMRSNGIAEKYCTGDASDEEKFLKWAETVPRTLRNPLYHWTHLELRRVFGIQDVLSPATAKKVWEAGNAVLARPESSVRGLMKKMNVRVVCTTDDPVDSLEHHASIAKNPFGVKVLPTFRPDKAFAVENPKTWNEWIDRLESASGVKVGSFESMIEALKKRHDFFHSLGGRVSDRGLDTVFADDFTPSGLASSFGRLRGSKAEVSPLSRAEIDAWKSACLHELALMDHARGWTMQLHIGALRNNNSRMKRTLGPDTGFDSISDPCYAPALARFLDRLDDLDRLPKTILYNLNPRDNEMIATMIGNFQDGTIPGKIQYGSGWWFLDQKSGMERQLDALSSLGLLSRFVGMLTDSRSFLSYPRHEYFRRILCNLLGGDMTRGEIPADFGLVGGLVQDVCWRNAKGYFGIDGLAD